MTHPCVCVHGGLRRQCEACDLADRLEGITTVYERFKHLDHLLSDDAWMEAGDPSPFRQMLYECWAAIREAAK